jgi:hypothetical protein
MRIKTENLEGAEKQYAESHNALVDKVEALHEGATKDELASLRTELEALKDNSNKAEFDALKSSVDEIRERQTETKSEVRKSIRDFIVDTKILDELKQKKSRTFDLKVEKDVGVVTTSNVVVADTQPVMSILGTQGALYQVNRWTGNNILEAVDYGMTDKATIVYVDEVNGEGSVGTTTEGNSKNQIDVDYKEVTVNAIKKTGLVKVTEEALDDISYMEGEINRVLTEKLDIHVQSDVLTDINTNATTYNLTDFNTSVYDADIIDAIVCAKAQSVLSGFEPTAIAMHPIDVAKFQLSKSNNIPRISTGANGLMVDGLRIYTTTNQTKDTFVLGDFKKYRFRMYSQKLTMGYDADDFSKNKRTLIGESRYIKYISTNEKTSLVKGTFSTIIAAINKAES